MAPILLIIFVAMVMLVGGARGCKLAGERVNTELSAMGDGKRGAWLLRVNRKLLVTGKGRGQSWNGSAHNSEPNF